jgi:hypothetical protein
MAEPADAPGDRVAQPDPCSYCGAVGHQVESGIGGAPVTGCPEYEEDARG